jgi:hypothetical protein
MGDEEGFKKIGMIFVFRAQGLRWWKLFGVMLRLALQGIKGIVGEFGFGVLADPAYLGCSDGSTYAAAHCTAFNRTSWAKRNVSVVPHNNRRQEMDHMLPYRANW